MDFTEIINEFVGRIQPLFIQLPLCDERRAPLEQAIICLGSALRKQAVTLAADKKAAYKAWYDAAPKEFFNNKEVVPPWYRRDHPPPSLA